MILSDKKKALSSLKLGKQGSYLNCVADVVFVAIRERSFMPPVLTPAADGVVTGFDVGSVGDDPRTTALRYVGHLMPQLLHFLIFWLLGALGTARRTLCSLCPLCFTKTSLALIAESVQLRLKCG